jgi:hypothetical protein
MSQPLISLLHPTARVKPSKQFPRGWRAAFDAWLERADHPERIEYVLSVHESRWEEFWDSEICDLYRRNAVQDGPVFRFDYPQCLSRITVIKNTQRDCNVDQLNNCAAHATGKLFVGVMDDFFPPEHWDTLLLDTLCEQGTEVDAEFLDLDSERIVLCASGATPERDRELMIAGAVTRKRYERYGYCLDPDFESMFADNWYAFVARRDEQAGLVKIIERLDIRFEHRHPAFGQGEMDEVYAHENRAQAYRQGQALFMRKAYGTKSIAACFAGENFRAEIFWERIDLLLNMNQGLRLLVAPFGEHSSNVYHTRIAIARAVLKQLPDVDYFLSVDDDNSLNVQQFNMLYQDLEEHPELDGVVGWCWCDHNGNETNEDGTPNPWMMSVGRQGSWEDGLPAWNFTLADFEKWTAEGKTLITSDDLAPDGFWSGFPVVLLRGDCLRELGPLAFAPLVNEKFADGFTGEDASFFYRGREAGMKFAVDLRVKVKHIKPRAIEPLELLPVLKREDVTLLPLAEVPMAGD